MCLHTPTDLQPPKTGKGWKVFLIKHEGKKKFLTSCNRHTDQPRQVGTWLRSTTDPTDIGIGWHIFTNRNDAEKFITQFPAKHASLRKVLYREARVRGLGDGFYNEKAKVVVAYEIKILSAKASK